MPDVISLITKDHRELEKLFDRLEKEPASRPELLPQMAAMFVAHSKAEESEVYPSVGKEAGDKDEMRHAMEEHKEADKLLRSLQRADPGSEQFTDRLREFVSAVSHHVEEEETEVLPGLKRAVAAKRLDELGSAFMRRRERELSGDGRHDGETKDDLYHEAQRLDISGRSRMSKEELAEAVRHAHR